MCADSDWDKGGQYQMRLGLVGIILAMFFSFAALAAPENTSGTRMFEAPALQPETPFLTKYDPESENLQIVQRALTILGYYDGPIDGVAGRGTVNSARLFFRDAGLSPEPRDSNLETLMLVSEIVVGRGISLQQAMRDVPAARRLWQTYSQFDAAANRSFPADAEQQLMPLLEESEQVFGGNGRITNWIVYSLGYALFSQGRFLEAETFFDRNHQSLSVTVGLDNPSVFRTKNMLAVLQEYKGKYLEAEKMYRDIFEKRKRVLGPNELDTIGSQINLANINLVQGDYKRALALFQTSLGLLRQSHPTEAGKTLTALTNIGYTLVHLGEAAAGESYMKEALELTLREFGTIDHRTLDAQVNYAFALLENGKPQLAEAILEEIVDTIDQSAAFSYQIKTGARRNLAKAHIAQGKYLEAEAHALAAVKALARLTELWTPESLDALHTLALAVTGMGDVERATGIYVSLTDLFEKSVAHNPSVSAAHLKSARDVAKDYFALLAMRDDLNENDIRASFTMQGWWTYNALEITLTDLGARLAASHPDAKELLREHQELRERLRALRSAYVASFEQAAAGEEQRRAYGPQISDAETRHAQILARIERDLPQVADILTPRSMTAGTAQELLQPSEALVAFAITDDAAYAWLVTPEQVDRNTIRLSRETLERITARLRAGVDLGFDPADPPPRPGCEVTSPAPILKNRPFDSCAAEILYRQLFDGFDLGAVEHLIVVPDGPLGAVPFAFLVVGRTDRGAPVWLIERHAISVLPTTSALRALRGPGSAGASRARHPFLGIAPGTFSGHSTNSPLQVVPTDLPGTVEEVRALSRLLDAGEASAVTGAAASESFVMGPDLADYRILSFATHGLVAAEAAHWTNGRISEPALVLSGPSETNDGILTASEATRLRLNADWVLLSGCNTAAGDGQEGAGLSGLARAFFFAGARSLLVSHWSIEDMSAHLLMTTTFATVAEDPQAGQAWALRRAMLALMRRPGFEHPFFWAPFELVGEGRTLTRPAGLAPGSVKLELLETAAGGLDIAPPLRGTFGKRTALDVTFLQEPGSKATEGRLQLDWMGRTEVQQRLTLLGHNTSGTDGVFGPRSRAAISSWQVAAGAPVTGYLTEGQLIVLRRQSQASFGEWIAAGNVLKAGGSGPRRQKKRRKGSGRNVPNASAEAATR